MVSECALSQVVKAMFKTVLLFEVDVVFRCLAHGKADISTITDLNKMN